MQKQFHFLSPVEVVKVTSQNLEEAAEWCGGSVQETESRRVPGRMDKYVLVPTPKGSSISWAFPGMFITKRLVVTVKDELRATFAVFRRDYYEKNYFDTPKAAADATWEREAAERKKPKKEEIKVMNNVGEKLLEAQRLIQDAGISEATAKATVESFIHDPGFVHYIHDHEAADGCDIHECTTERYADGYQVFSDKTFFCEPDKEPVEVNLNEAVEA